MIFGERSITFRYRHTNTEISRTVEFKTNFGDLKKLETDFIEQLKNLKRYHVPSKIMLPLVCKVFAVNVSEEVSEQLKRVNQLRDLRNKVELLTYKYFDEMGENAYAALNVITDLATRPVSYISPAAVVDQLQRRSGKWVDDFINRIRRDDFDFDTYLGDFAKTADRIQNLN
jgi:hypothetical protein